MVEPGGIEPPTSCMPFIGDINDFNGLVGIVELDCLTFIGNRIDVNFDPYFYRGFGLKNQFRSELREVILISSPFRKKFIGTDFAYVSYPPNR